MKPSKLNAAASRIALLIVSSLFAGNLYAETCVVKTPETVSLMKNSSPYCEKGYNIAVQGELVTFLRNQKNYILENANIFNNNCFSEGLVLQPKGAMVSKNVWGDIKSVKLNDIYFDLVYRAGFGRGTVKIADDAFASQLPSCDSIVDILNRAGIRNPKIKQHKGWVLDQLIYLLNLMDATKESNGLSMLDNSLVVLISNGACSIHSYQDIPVITFGSLGGALKTGNYINYQRTTAPQLIGGHDGGPAYKYNLGRPLASFYTTLLNALKISHTGFGNYVNAETNYSEFITAQAKQANLPVRVQRAQHLRG